MAVKIVKSVARVLEILELFQKERRALTAAEIATWLDYPVASTHEILKTMVEYGYFTYGNPRWTYQPSGQFPSVVEWVRDSLSSDNNLMKFMEALNAETRETINLSRRISTRVKIFQGLECLYEIGVSSKPGTLMPVTQSLTGITALSHMDSETRMAYIDSLEAEDPDQYKRLDLNLLNGIVSDIERQGAVLRTDVNIEGIGAICIPVISEHSRDDLVIGIVGPSERIRSQEDNLWRILKRLTRTYKIKTRYRLTRS